jgi:hypothetical protein
LWARRARFPLALSIVECIRAQLRTGITVLAPLERVANRSAANRVGSAHPNAVCDRHVVSPAHRSPDAASDCEADPSRHAAPHASADRQTDTNPAACEQVDPAWLTDE